MNPNVNEVKLVKAFDTMANRKLDASLKQAQAQIKIVDNAVDINYRDIKQLKAKIDQLREQKKQNGNELRKLVKKLETLNENHGPAGQASGLEKEINELKLRNKELKQLLFDLNVDMKALQAKDEQYHKQFQDILDELVANAAMCIAQGADPNHKTANEVGLLVLIGNLIQASDVEVLSAQRQYRKNIEALHLNPNITTYSVPAFNYLLENNLYKTNDKHLYEVIFEHKDFNLNYGESVLNEKNERKAKEYYQKDIIHDDLENGNPPGLLRNHLYGGANQGALTLEKFVEKRISPNLIKYLNDESIDLEDKFNIFNDEGKKRLIRDLINSTLTQIDHDMRKRLENLDESQQLLIKEEFEEKIKQVEKLKDEPLLKDGATEQSLHTNINEVYRSTVTQLLGYIEQSDLEKNGITALKGLAGRNFDENLTVDDLHEGYRRLIDKEALVNFKALSADEKNLLSQFLEQSQAAKTSERLVMYAHKMGLAGVVQVKSDNHNFALELEGFNVKHTVPSVLNSIQKYSPQAEEDKKLFQVIEGCYERYSKVVSTDLDDVKNWEEQAQSYEEGKPIMFESRWEGHSAMTVLYQDHIYICNKGAGTSRPSIKSYHIGNLSSLLGKDVNTAEKLMEISRTNRKDHRFLGELSGILPVGKRFSNVSFMKDLQLEKVNEVMLKGQKVGNCSYTNTKRGVHALMLALHDRTELGVPENHPWKDVCQPKNMFNLSKEDLKKDKIEGIYQSFSSADKQAELDSLLELIEGLDREALLDTHKGVFDVLILTLKGQNDPNNEGNVNYGQQIVDKLKGLGFTGEEIVDAVMSRRSFLDTSALYLRAQQANSNKFSDDVRKNAKAQFYYQSYPQGDAIQTKSFLSKLDLKSDKLNLTEEEKQVKEKIGKRVNDPKDKPAQVRAIVRFKMREWSSKLKQSRRMSAFKTKGSLRRALSTIEQVPSFTEEVSEEVAHFLNKILNLDPKDVNQAFADAFKDIEHKERLQLSDFSQNLRNFKAGKPIDISVDKLADYKKLADNIFENVNGYAQDDLEAVEVSLTDRVDVGDALSREENSDIILNERKRNLFNQLEGFQERLNEMIMSDRYNVTETLTAGRLVNFFEEYKKLGDDYNISEEHLNKLVGSANSLGIQVDASLSANKQATHPDISLPEISFPSSHVLSVPKGSPDSPKSSVPNPQKPVHETPEVQPSTRRAKRRFSGIMSRTRHASESSSQEGVDYESLNTKFMQKLENDGFDKHLLRATEQIIKLLEDRHLLDEQDLDKSLVQNIRALAVEEEKARREESSVTFEHNVDMHLKRIVEKVPDLMDKRESLKQSFTKIVDDQAQTSKRSRHR